MERRQPEEGDRIVFEYWLGSYRLQLFNAKNEPVDWPGYETDSLYIYHTILRKELFLPTAKIIATLLGFELEADTDDRTTFVFHKPAPS